MKKIICLMLAILMIISMVSCGDVKDPSNDTEETTTETKAPVNNDDDDNDDDDEDTGKSTTDKSTTDEPTTDEPTTDEPTTEPETTEPEVTVPEVTVPETTEPEGTDPEPPEEVIFQAGYSREVITPSTPIAEYTAVGDDLYATCIAVYDGEKTALFISLDLKSLMPDYCASVQKKVNATTKVPMENIFVSVTHTHSTVEIGDHSTWAFNVYNKIAKAAKQAIADLGDAEMYVGTGSVPDATFVRRYVDGNGNYASINPGNYDTVELDPATTKCVSEPDDSLQVVRFIREDKKDIVLLNWQGHLAHAINYMPETISADIAHFLREDIETADRDTSVILIVGASGNLNLNAPNEESQKYPDYIEVAHAISAEALKVLKKRNLTKIDAGNIIIERETYTAENKRETQAEIEAAQQRLNNHEGTSYELIRDRYIIARNKASSSKLNIAAVSIGDLAFVTAPYEMFDNNGMQIKEGSPFKMTVVMTNSGGAWAYMPSIEAWTEYGGYETWATYFAPGVAEKLVERFLYLLGEVNPA